MSSSINYFLYDNKHFQSSKGIIKRYREYKTAWWDLFKESIKRWHFKDKIRFCLVRSLQLKRFELYCITPSNKYQTQIHFIANGIWKANSFTHSREALCRLNIMINIKLLLHTILHKKYTLASQYLTIQKQHLD